MRILLQQKTTGLYFTAEGTWGHSGEAKDFVSSTSALEYCLTRNLSGVQLVLKFDDQPYDIVWPVVSPDAGKGQRRAVRAVC
jgi:hypothetical protein